MKKTAKNLLEKPIDEGYIVLSECSTEVRFNHIASL